MAKKAFPIKCLGAKFLVKAEPDESVSAGGIILIRKEEEICKTGTIVSVGHKSMMKVGQRVMFRTLAMKTIKHQLEDYFSVPDDSVLVVFDEKEPLGCRTIKNRILVKDEPKPETSKSGLFITHDKEDYRKGVIIKCGAECDAARDDVIIYNHDIGVKIVLEKKNYLVMRNDNIMAIIEGKKAHSVSIS